MSLFSDDLDDLVQAEQHSTFYRSGSPVWVRQRRRHMLLRAACFLVVAGVVLVGCGIALSFVRSLVDSPPKRAVDVATALMPSLADGAPTNVWVAELSEDADPLKVAREHGAVYLGVVAGLRGFHRFESRPRDPTQPAQRSNTRSFSDSVAEGDLGWAEQQVARKRYTRAAAPLPTAARTSAAPLGFGLALSDPLLERQWHLGAASVPEAWRNGPGGHGPLGQDVIVAVVDDGVERRHPDLAERYVAAASRDVNSRDYDPTPMNGDSHGTSAAGVAVATSNLDCGIGVAPLASLAGVRLIGAPATDSDEAEGLVTGLILSGMPASVGPNKRGVSVYSCSWGPVDDGKRLEGPMRLAMLAIERGVREGRQGRGAVYVWASGNGKASGDRADYDNYASSRYTVAVGAVGRHGRAPWYSEPGASVLVCAPSSDGIDSITTSRAPSGCTSSFGGTSAAAPLVAGIVALMLETRPELGWRDVQHVLARTATRNDPTFADWQLNGGGLYTSHQYGYGAVNATRAVSLARTWRLVGAQSVVESPPLVEYANASPGAPAVVRASLAQSLYVEHVELDVEIACANRGLLALTLTSPAGTRSEFMQPHSDIGKDVRWTFTSMRLLGELSRGMWTLTLELVPPKGVVAATLAPATLRAWRLRVYGTVAAP